MGMFCNHCGKPLEEGTKFCMSCGAPVGSAEVKPAFELNTKGEKPVKKGIGAGKIILIALAALLVIGGVLVALNFNAITSWYDRTFKSPSEMFDQSGSASVGDVTDGIGDIYDTIINPGQAADAAKGSITLHLGDMAKTLLGQAIGMNLNWVDGISLQITAGEDDGLTQAKLDLVLSDVSVLSLDVIASQEKIWLGIPGLAEGYLEMDLEEILAQADVDLSALDSFSAPSLEDMPSGDAFANMLEQYLNIIVNSITDVKEVETTLQVNGVSQNVLQLTTTVDFAAVEKMLSDMVSTLEKDTVAEQFLDSLEKFLGEYMAQMEQITGEHYELENLYDTTLTGMKQLLQLLTAQKDLLSDWKMELITYLNDSNETIGFELRDQSGTTGIFAARVENDGNFASKFSAADFAVYGMGTISGGKESGVYSFVAGGDIVLKMETRNFATTDDGFTGSIRVIPSEDILGQILDTGMVGTQLALEFTQVKENGMDALAVNLLINEQMLVGISVGAEPLDWLQVSEPTDVVDINDQQALMNWAQGLNLSTVLNNLQRAGVPQELLSLLTGSVAP